MYFLVDVFSPVNFIRLHMGKQVHSGRLQSGDSDIAKCTGVQSLGSAYVTIFYFFGGKIQSF